jgi:pimeloyl-ACP methyl ester carboxylesterase
MTQFVRSSDDTRLAIESAGAGPAVVLVDGALGSRGSHATVTTAGLLAPRFSVYRYDRRGRGESDDAPRGLEGEIADLAAVFAEAGGSAFVFGTSSGGNLALHAAAAGIPITKLALWEPNFVVSESRSPLPPEYVEHLDELVGSDRRGEAVEYFMTAAVGVPGEFVAPMREMPMWLALEADAHTLAYDGEIVAGQMAGTPPTQAEWQAVTVSTVVLDGGTTPWLSEGADAIAAALPNAVRKTLAGQQHNVDPAALAPELSDFFGE